MKPLKGIVLALILALPSMAALADPYTYSPESCEFTMTFPSEPIIENKCELPDTHERCYDLIQFTQVFDLDATIDFKIICNPITEDIKSTYSDKVIVATLEQMTKDKVNERFEANIITGEGYKLAGIVGRGQKGMDETMYMAQLWLGDKSAMSLEAEMSGQQSADADKMFKEILSSVYFKATQGKDSPPPEVLKDQKSGEAAPEKSETNNGAKP